MKMAAPYQNSLVKWRHPGVIEFPKLEGFLERTVAATPWTLKFMSFGTRAHAGSNAAEIRATRLLATT